MKKLFILGFIVCIFLIPPSFANNTPQILIVYSEPSDLTYISDKIDSQMYQITSITFEDISENDILSADQVIMISGEEFSIEDPVEDALASFIQDKEHSLFIMTPYLEEFHEDELSAIGITEFNDVIPKDDEEDNSTWNFTLKSDIGNYSSGNSFIYTGRIGIFNTSKPVMLDINDTTIIEDQNYMNYPVIINSTTQAHIIVSGIAPPKEGEEFNSMYTINQVPILDTLMEEIIKLSTSNQLYRINISDNGTNPTNTNGEDPTDTSPVDIFPNIPSFNFGTTILYALIAIVILIFVKISGVINWLKNKSYALLFFIVGAFYNVQDRSLEYNQVMLNTSRVHIMDFLNHVGKHGAYLREIKSQIKMGTGSLLWHLQVLEDFHLIQQMKINGFTVFVSDQHFDQFDPRLKEVELNIQSKYIFSLLEVLQNYSINDEVPLGEIQEETNINRRTLRRLLKKMEKYSMITIIRGPSLIIQLENMDYISSLYNSYQLRNSFDQDENGVNVSFVD